MDRIVLQFGITIILNKSFGEAENSFAEEELGFRNFVDCSTVKSVD